MEKWEFLPCFMAAAEKGNFTRAAESLFYSQAYVSRQIAELEKSLDTALFIRKNKSVELTEAGRLLYERAEHINAEIDRLQEDMQQFRQMPLENNLTVYCDSYSYAVTENVIKEYLRQNEAVRIQLITESVNDPSADRDITCFYSREEEPCGFETLFTAKEVIVLDEASPLAKKRRLQLSDLNGHTCMILRKTERHLQWQDFLTQHGIGVAFDETDSVYMAMALLAQNPDEFEVWEDYSHICQPIQHHVIRPMEGLGKLYFHMDLSACDKPAAKDFYRFAKEYLHLKHKT